MISRRILGGVLLALAGCGGKAPFGPDALPKAVDGGWTLAHNSDLPETLWPEAVRALRAKRAVLAEYQGPQAQRVTIYELPADASAFELVQKWRPVPGTVALQHKALFLVAEPPSPEFVKAFERALP